MDKWPEFCKAEQAMDYVDGNRVYKALITEEQYSQARDAVAWRNKATEIYPNIAAYIDERIYQPQPTGKEE